MWFDAASFKLNDMINGHNYVIYATENLHLTYEKRLNQPGITVWGALSSDGLLDPYLFDETVTGDNYFEMLNEYVFPRLRDRPDFNNLLFMQDGASPHYAKKVRDLLDTLPAGWVGRKRSINWAPRSCDLTPMNFSIWGMMKEKFLEESQGLCLRCKLPLNPSSNKLMLIRYCVVKFVTLYSFEWKNVSLKKDVSFNNLKNVSYLDVLLLHSVVKIKYLLQLNGFDLLSGDFWPPLCIYTRTLTRKQFAA